MRRLMIVLLALSFTSALAQGPVPVRPGINTANLPDAPGPQMASLFAGPRTNVQADFDESLSIPTAPASLEGTRVMLSMLLALSSKSPAGTSFRARLDDSLQREGQMVLPQGTIFEGHVETRPARRMMRPGALYMTFDRMILPSGDVRNVHLHVVNAESQAVKTDAEGRFRPAVSKKRLAIQLGGTALTAKFADDLAELIGGTALGAGSARIVGAGAATTFFLFQKGREVNLNSGDKINVEFDRAGLSPSDLLQGGR